MNRGLGLGICLACLWAIPAQGAGPFVFPADGPVPFRKHQIPLEAQQLDDLARSLLLLADSVGADSPEERRAVAQIFALAGALDPENRDLARLRTELVDRDFDGVVPFDKVRGRVRTIWNAITWLETPDAGIDGQALAACLKDIMVVMDSDNMRVPALKEAGEIGAWASWVEPVSAFRSREMANDDPEPGWNVPKPGKEETGSPAEPTRIRLEEGSLPTVLWMPGEEGAEQYTVAKMEPLSMKAYLRDKPKDEEEEYHSFHISIGAWGDSPHTGRLSRLVEGIIRNRYPDLPEGLHIEIRNPALEGSLETKQSHALSAVSAVLTISALSGNQPSGMILGVLDEDGRFQSSRDMWPKLGALGKEEGLRLIVPETAEEYLSAFLAMEQPDFLLKNEVYTAADLDGILELSANPPPPGLKEISDRFVEIREKRGATETGFYLANPFVRQRLIAIHKDEPRHLSAKLLALQSVGKRPVSVSRRVLASELRQSLRPMGGLVRREYIAPRGDGVGELYEQCRKSVEFAAQYARREDQELVGQANDVLNRLRTLDRAIRKKGGEFWEAERDVNAAKRELVDAYRAFHDVVSEILEKDG